jgi:hypothetical protein
MSARVTSVNPWMSYRAWSELRADRAQLAADLAAKASPQVIAADRAGLTDSNRRYGIEAGRLDRMA